MVLGLLRPHFRKISDILAIPFVKLGIHPNIISFLGIPFAFISAYFLFQQNYLFGLIFFIPAISMDFIDGSAARISGKKSHFGNYFETMIDKFVEVILLLPFAFFYPVATFLALALSLLNSYAKPRVALVIVTDNRDWPAIAEHGERLTLLMLGVLISHFFVSINGFNVMEVILYLLAFLSFLGLIQRMFYAKELIREAEEKGNILPYLK